MKATKKKSSKKKVAPQKKSKKKTVKKSAKTTAKKAAVKKASKKKVAKKTPAKTMLPSLGSDAPAFTLLDQSNSTVSLDDLRGKKVVVYFYPRAMTPGCTTQACGLRDVKVDLAKRNIVVLGISPDKTVSLQKFIDKENLNFTLLSDTDHTVAKAYGAYGEKQFMGRTFNGVLRQSYLIDESGKIVHIISKVNTATHAQDIMDIFDQLA